MFKIRPPAVGTLKGGISLSLIPFFVKFILQLTINEMKWKDNDKFQSDNLICKIWSNENAIGVNKIFGF